MDSTSQNHKLPNEQTTVARLCEELMKKDHMIARLERRIKKLREMTTGMSEEIDKVTTCEFELWEELIDAQMTIEQLTLENRNPADHLVQLEVDRENARQELATKNREVAEKNALILKYQTGVSRSELQKTGVLPAQVSNQQFENEKLKYCRDEERDEILSRIRAAIAHTVQGIMRDMDSMQGIREDRVNQAGANQRYTVVRSKLTEMTNQLKKENLDMRRICEKRF